MMLKTAHEFWFWIEKSDLMPASPHCSRDKPTLSDTKSSTRNSTFTRQAECINCIKLESVEIISGELLKYTG